MTQRGFTGPVLYLAAMFVQTGFAQSPAKAPEFEAATIKRNMSGSNRVSYSGPPDSGTLTATNVNLRLLISIAWKVRTFEILGGQGWINSDRYDVVAKPAESAPGEDEARMMLRRLLEDRFKLMVHRETKEMPVFALLANNNGAKLRESKPGSCITFGPNSPAPSGSSPGQSSPGPCVGFFMGPGTMVGGKVFMGQFADALSEVVGRIVIDKTGYTGTFDLRLEFAPEGTSGLTADGADDSSRPSIFTAVKQQLGLRLESQRSPAQILVIDHVENAPTEN
jgi:uncharacterized protein (TIGR03435 family)